MVKHDDLNSDPKSFNCFDLRREFCNSIIENLLTKPWNGLPADPATRSGTSTLAPTYCLAWFSQMLASFQRLPCAGTPSSFPPFAIDSSSLNNSTKVSWTFSTLARCQISFSHGVWHTKATCLMAFSEQIFESFVSDMVLHTRKLHWDCRWD